MLKDPIGLLPILSIVLEKAVSLLKYLQSNCIVPECQSRFRNRRSTTTILLHVIDDILVVPYENPASVLVLIDYRHYINRNILVDKLNYYGCDNVTCSWLRSYFNKQAQITVRTRSCLHRWK